MPDNKTLLKTTGDLLISETQYGVVKCGAACIKIVYEMCSKLTPNITKNDKSITQESCDRASADTSTLFLRKLISGSLFRRMFGRHEFGLTLTGITRGVNNVLESLGYTGRKVIGSSLQDLKNHLETGLPCIVLYLEGVANNPWSPNKIVDGRERNSLHYSVIYHISQTHVSVRDPNNNHHTLLPIAEFEKRRGLDHWYLNDRRAKWLHRLGLIQRNSVIFVDNI